MTAQFQTSVKCEDSLITHFKDINKNPRKTAH